MYRPGILGDYSQTIRFYDRLASLATGQDGNRVYRADEILKVLESGGE